MTQVIDLIHYTVMDLKPLNFNVLAFNILLSTFHLKTLHIFYGYKVALCAYTIVIIYKIEFVFQKMKFFVKNGRV